MKRLKVIARIAPGGKTTLTIEGAQGDECLTILGVMEKIEGMRTLETERVDHDDRDVEIVGDQTLGEA